MFPWDQSAICAAGNWVFSLPASGAAIPSTCMTVSCVPSVQKNRSLSKRNASVDAPGAAEKVEALRGL